MKESDTGSRGPDRMRTHSCQGRFSSHPQMESLERVIDSLKRAMSESFWGEVNIKFKDGKAVLMTTISQTKIEP